ncbi:hypothetical protein CY35_03G075300 [Sphagnum magellanicum]|nr:hypothetical protein CY35_03G075300 [Sphagnum magellanicum]
MIESVCVCPYFIHPLCTTHRREELKPFKSRCQWRGNTNSSPSKSRCKWNQMILMTKTATTTAHLSFGKDSDRL